MPNVKVNASVTLAYRTLDLERYSEEARMLWKLHYAQTAQDALTNLTLILLHFSLYEKLQAVVLRDM
jgi:hypothetical protein